MRNRMHQSHHIYYNLLWQVHNCTLYLKNMSTLIKIIKTIPMRVFQASIFFWSPSGEISFFKKTLIWSHMFVNISTVAGFEKGTTN